jgi:protoporphyrin/coproporphyrin ferrochelatase
MIINSASKASEEGRIGVLLVNLGTPDSPGVGDVRKYLREFLMDKRVVDIPSVPRWLLVNGIIAPFRSPKSAKAYKELWMEDGGSPLKHYSVGLTEGVQAALGNKFVVRLGMRYQEPALEQVLEGMRAEKLKQIIIVSLFPQYASATTGSVVEEVMRVVSGWQNMPELSMITRFFEREDVIEAYAIRGRKMLESGVYDHVLFSYHGLPARQIRKADDNKVCKLGECCSTYTADNQWCYRGQCFATTRAILAKIDWPVEKTTTCFQSRLGQDEWVKPYTEATLRDLAAKGVKRILCFSPAFVADCLETILEIGDEYAELFHEIGGESIDLVPSLNVGQDWIDAVTKMVLERVPGYKQTALEVSTIA